MSIPIQAKLVERPPSAAKIIKNMNFGIAVGLTETAKQGQRAVQGSLKSSFTLRGGWTDQSNKFGIKIKPAKRDDLTAEVRTNADWIEKQKKGGSVSGTKPGRTFKYRYGGETYIARPTRELRPKGSTKVLKREVWPSTLRKKKGTFVIKAKSGSLLLMNRFADGPGGLTSLYILDPVITIKPVDTFEEPITKVVNRRLTANIEAGLKRAFATMR